MATYNFTSASISSDALLQTFWTNMNTGLTTVGLSSVTQTGEVNLATVTRSVGTSYGFRMYRFNDTLQSTTPLFLKLEISCTTSATVLMRASYGTNNNGSGTLTGQVADLTFFTSTSSTSALDIRISGDTNRLSLMYYTTFPGTMAFVTTVDRFKSALGVDVSTGIHTFVFGGNSTATRDIALPASGTVPAANPPWTIHSAAGLATSTYGGNVFISPVFPVLGPPLPPSTNITSFLSSDVVNGTTFSVPLYGTNRTFLATPVNASLSNSNARFAFRYE